MTHILKSLDNRLKNKIIARLHEKLHQQEYRPT
jgi:hypothetical protein